MKLFLGVDGGQSGTTALIGDENGTIQGVGEAGPCNHASGIEGRLKLERAVRGSVGSACAAAGIDADTVRFVAACFGMSGGGEDKAAILREILQADELLVTTDAATALAGATADGQGIITIAGTGSIALGRNHSGKTARAGGWGYVFGDEGGAFDIARQAVRAVVRMEEGWGPPTSLRQVLLEATESETANQMLHRFYTAEWPRSRVARLAPLVDQAASASDAVALQIVNRAGQELALLAGAVRAQLWQPGDAVYVAYIGGAFQSALLRERFRVLIELEEGNRCGPPLYGPAEGALREAYRTVGLNPPIHPRI